MKKRQTVLLFAALLSSCVASSGKREEEALSIEGEKMIGLREYADFSAYLGKDKADVSWSSSDSAILQISSTGVAKGLSLGDAVVEAKTKKGQSASFAVTVTESMIPDQLIQRVQKKARYSLSAEGTYGEKKVDFSLDFYPDSLSINGASGYAEGKEGPYAYDKTGKTYLRNDALSYDSLSTDLLDLSSSSFPSIRQKGDEYTLSSSLGQQFFLQATWFDNLEYLSLTNPIASCKMKVEGPTAFAVDLSFKNGEISLNYTIPEETENPFLSSLTGEVSYPEVLSPIEKVAELAKGNNYSRDLGKFTPSGGSPFSRGTAYYAERYVYFDYSDQMIQAMAGNPDTALTRGGYIELHDDTHDGVYAFTVVDGEVKIGSLYQENGVSYSHYYDFYESLYYVMKRMSSKLYTFDTYATAQYNGVYPEFLSQSKPAISLDAAIFSSYISLLSAAPEGLLLAVSYQEDDPSSSIVNYGGILGVNGQHSYLYSEYPYSNFGKTHVDILEALL